MHEMKNRQKKHQEISEKIPHAVRTQNLMNAWNNDDDTFSLKSFHLFISAWIRFGGTAAAAVQRPKRLPGVKRKNT